MRYKKKKTDTDKYRKFINKVNSKILSAMIKSKKEIPGIEITNSHRETYVEEDKIADDIMKNIKSSSNRTISFVGDLYLGMIIKPEIKLDQVDYIVDVD